MRELETGSHLLWSVFLSVNRTRRTRQLNAISGPWFHSGTCATELLLLLLLWRGTGSYFCCFEGNNTLTTDRLRPFRTSLPPSCCARVSVHPLLFVTYWVGYDVCRDGHLRQPLPWAPLFPTPIDSCWRRTVLRLCACAGTRTLLGYTSVAVLACVDALSNRCVETLSPYIHSLHVFLFF